MTKNYPSENYYKNLNYYKDMHKNGYHLIDGRKRDAKNAHINIQKPNWWSNKIENLLVNQKEIKVICICTIKDDGKVKHIPLEYGCKIKDYL